MFDMEENLFDMDLYSNTFSPHSSRRDITAHPQYFPRSTSPASTPEVARADHPGQSPVLKRSPGAVTGAQTTRRASRTRRVPPAAAALCVTGHTPLFIFERGGSSRISKE